MADEWLLHEPRVERFVGEIKPIFRKPAGIQQRLDEARPIFHELLMQDGWLPDEFARRCEDSGMGEGIGTWLMCRTAEGDLSLFSLVVDPGRETPVHDHLCWGLVGLYRGSQSETVYRRRTGSEAVELVEERPLERGGIYDLIPPDGDIHSVATISDEPSVSIHLLGSDIGCMWRHRYDVAAGAVHDFRSGYSNMGCKD
jgi:predicted metal-dependent enzyme (double-stranded beta helix superfamily)